MKIIDAHAHLRLQPGAVEKLLSTMDSNGVHKTVVVAGGTVSPETLSIHFTNGGGADVDVDNDAIRAACDTSNGRLLPFFFANPMRGSGPYRAAGKNFFGLKLAPIVHGVPFHDLRIHDLIDATREFNHPVYLHCLPRPGFTGADLIELAKAHPQVPLIMGHGGVGHGDFHGISLIKNVPNIYFEVSGSFALATKLAYQTLGAERVLFGSEYPLQDHRVELEKMRILDCSEHERSLMMRENILRLIGQSA